MKIFSNKSDKFVSHKYSGGPSTSPLHKSVLSLSSQIFNRYIAVHFLRFFFVPIFVRVWSVHFVYVNDILLADSSRIGLPAPRRKALHNTT